MSADKFGFELVGNVISDSGIFDDYTVVYDMRFGQVEATGDDLGELYLRDDLTLKFTGHGYSRSGISEDYYFKRMISPLDMPSCYVNEGVYAERLLNDWQAKRTNILFHGSRMALDAYTVSPYGSTGRALSYLAKVMDWPNSKDESKWLSKQDEDTYKLYCQIDVLSLVLWRFYMMGIRAYTLAPKAAMYSSRYVAVDNAAQFSWSNLSSRYFDTARRLRGEW